MAKVVYGGPIRAESGDLMNEPSEDVFMSHVSEGGPAANSSPHLRGRIGKVTETDNALTFLVTPRLRMGRGRLQMLRNGRWQKVSDQDERQRGGKAPAERHRAEEPDFGFAATVVDADFAHAGNRPFSG